MKDIKKYELEDFVQYPFFRKWVLGKLPHEEIFWENWVLENPDKKLLIDEARSLVIATQIDDTNFSNEEINEGIQQILYNVNHQEKRNFIQKHWLKIAASLLLVAGLGWLQFGFRFDNSSRKISSRFEKSTETENQNENPLELTLADGTKVTLKKGSKLLISDDFGLHTRSVMLKGEAFFDVKKDPNHPFIVYAGGIVTKVLGTSFNVRAYENESKTLVAVSRGKVTVFQEKKTIYANQTNPEQILLTPNQQVVFEKSQDKLLKTLVEKPVLLITDAQNAMSSFDEIPIPKILNFLEKSYGVKIVFDEDILAHCNLTATFTNESLYEKMDIICETIKAKYEIADGQIVIYSKGCK